MVCFDFVCFYLNSLVVAVFFSLFILINSFVFPRPLSFFGNELRAFWLD